MPILAARCIRSKEKRRHSLTVQRTVTDTDYRIDPNQPPPLNVIFLLEEASGVPGGSVTVPFLIRASVPSQGFSYSIDFDEGVLQSTATRKLWARPEGTPYEFEKFEVNNLDQNPGSGGPGDLECPREHPPGHLARERAVLELARDAGRLPQEEPHPAVLLVLGRDLRSQVLHPRPQSGHPGDGAMAGGFGVPAGDLGARVAA